MYFLKTRPCLNILRGLLGKDSLYQANDHNFWNGEWGSNHYIWDSQALGAAISTRGVHLWKMWAFFLPSLVDVAACNDD